MADVTTNTTIANGPKNLVVRLTNFSDGSGEAGVLKVDAGDYGRGLGVDRIDYVVRNGGVRLQWDGDIDRDLVILNGEGSIRFEGAGGERVPADLAGGTGDIRLSTIGFMPNSSYDITIRCNKGSPPAADDAIIERLSVPAGFGYSPPFSIFRLASGEYRTNFFIDAVKPAVAVTYYVSTTGNDGNDGLSEGQALAGIDTAIAKADVDQIIIAPGVYNDANGWNGVIPTRSIVMRCPNGRATSTRRQTQVWSLTGGETYQATTAATQAPVDTFRTDAEGARERLTLAAGLVGGQLADRGTYWSDGVTMYVRLGDGRSPISDATFFLPSTNDNGRTGANAITLWLENIDFIGGALAFNFAPAAAAAALYTKNCSFQASANDNTFRHTGGGICVHQGALAAGAFNDGFNYAQSTNQPTAIEISCKSVGCGIQAAGSANNASSIHNSGFIVRVDDPSKAGPWGGSGAYLRAQNRVINDINSAQSWNIGLTIGPSRAADATGVSVAAGSADAQSADIFLEGCDIEQSADSELFAYTGSTINYRNMSIAGLTTGGGGTIGAYS